MSSITKNKEKNKVFSCTGIDLLGVTSHVPGGITSKQNDEHSCNFCQN